MHTFSLVTVATLLLTTIVNGHPFSLEKREQSGVPATPDLKLKPLDWGDVNFIHTTDTHGWLEV